MVDENNPLENLKEVMEAKVAENAAGEDALVETDGEAAPETAAATDTLVEEAPVWPNQKLTNMAVPMPLVSGKMRWPVSGSSRAAVNKVNSREWEPFRASCVAHADQPAFRRCRAERSVRRHLHGQGRWIIRPGRRRPSWYLEGPDLV